MARPALKERLNLSDPVVNQRYRNWIRSLQRSDGKPSWYRCANEPEAHTRSSNANRYYHAAIVREFWKFLRAQGQVVTHDECHEMLKEKVLPEPEHVYDRTTGELLVRRRRTTHDMTVEQFYDYCEQCRAWLMDMFDIECQGPGQVAGRREVAA